ncbi:MAG: Gfo/Idh/MocA family oxidoreductase [Ruminococcaceae bacterium]|nr:Gfo/Idh/MocA family oxidoreductase [Oscillospiraceae bacterium]
MANPIKLGLVGIGRAGNGMHRSELASRGDKFQFAAVCDIIEERAAAMAAECGCRGYTKIEDILADPEVEVVDIATRSADHYKHAKMALLAGKNVFLEKPFCMNTAEAKELISLGSEPGGPKLFIRHNRRFEGGFETAMEIINSGKLGDVYEIKLTRNSYQRRKDWQTISEFGGGQLLNWGPHIIDHSLRFCGGDYTDLYSSIKHVAAAGDCEDHIKIVFTGVNGRVVDMEISGGMAIPTPVYTVYGSKGAMVSEGESFRLKYLDPAVALSEVKADPATPGSGAAFGNTEELKWVEETIPFEDGTDRVWDALYDAIRFGKEYPIPLYQAAKVVEVIEKVKEGTVFQNK